MKIGKASTHGYVGAGFAVLPTEAECSKRLHVPVAVGAVSTSRDGVFLHAGKKPKRKPCG